MLTPPQHRCSGCLHPRNLGVVLPADVHRPLTVGCTLLLLLSLILGTRCQVTLLDIQRRLYAFVLSDSMGRKAVFDMRSLVLHRVGLQSDMVNCLSETLRVLSRDSLPCLKDALCSCSATTYSSARVHTQLDRDAGHVCLPCKVCTFIASASFMATLALGGYLLNSA